MKLLTGNRCGADQGEMLRNVATALLGPFHREAYGEHSLPVPPVTQST